jgi:hypothetical protein
MKFECFANGLHLLVAKFSKWSSDDLVMLIVRGKKIG